MILVGDIRRKHPVSDMQENEKGMEKNEKIITYYGGYCNREVYFC